MAHILRSESEAIQAAHELATLAARDASRRDRERILPVDELERFSASGLGSISIPKEYGGPGFSFVTLAEVFAIVSAADPSFGQVPQNHFGIVAVLKEAAGEEQKRRFFGSVLAGERIGNAGPERRSKHTLDVRTRLRWDGESFRLSGEKFYSTGALFAHWITVKAMDDHGQSVMAFVRQGTPGLRIVDDWSGFGQRTTASGTVLLEDVRVEPRDLVYTGILPKKPGLQGATSQLIQAAIDAGIARAAVADTIDFVRHRARPWVDAGVDAARREPFTIAEIGKLQIELHAAEALLTRAARTLDEAASRPVDADSAASASIAVAEAKALTTEIALLASEKLFELAGSRATLAEWNLDRHWRNARTHTVHDPVRWKYHAVGAYWLNGTRPARHSWI